MFEALKKRLSDWFGVLRIRLRYYASSILLWSGIAYCVFGIGFLIASFLYTPWYLLPALFGVCIGPAMFRYRTEGVRRFLVWWDVVCVALFIALIISLVVDVSRADEYAAAIGLFLAVSGPSLVVLTHGHSLFGPKAPTHREVKELYYSYMPPEVRLARSSSVQEGRGGSKWLFPFLSKCGGAIVGFVIALVALLVILGIIQQNDNANLHAYSYRAGTSYSQDDKYSSSSSLYDSQPTYSSYAACDGCDSGYSDSGNNYSGSANLNSSSGSSNWREDIRNGWERTKEWCSDHKGEIAGVAAAAAVTAAAIALSGGDSSSADSTGYSYRDSHSTIGAGRPFSQSQKAEILRQNMERNGGVLRSDLSGEILVAPQQCRPGVTPSPFEAQIDHIFPRSRGGANSAENAQVLGRRENILKSNHVEEGGGFWSNLFK